MSDSNLFYHWATQFSGCDGGLIDEANTWICGLEWGTGGTNYKEYLETIQKQMSSLEEIKKLEKQKTTPYIFKDNTYPFGRLVSQIYTLLNGKSFDEYEEFTKTFPGKEIFKINLYPVAFKNFNDEQWQQMGHLLPQFKNKFEYKLWCKLNRFPMFKENITKYKPKRIICVGITSVDDFINALFVSDSKSEYKIHEGHLEDLSQSKPRRTFYYGQMSTGTYFYVIPFSTSANGLNSRPLVEQLGKKMKEFEKI